MTEAPCHREAEVLTAVRTGRFSDELRIHAMDCPDCSDLVLVAGVLNRGAAELAEVGPLPDAQYLWWRANLEQREIRSRRATSIITMIQRVAVVSGALVAATFLWGALPKLLSWFAPLGSSARMPSLPDSVASPGLVILVCLGLLAAPKVLGLYGGWAED